MVTVWLQLLLHSKIFNNIDDDDDELDGKSKQKNLHTSCPASFSSAADSSERKLLSSTQMSILHSQTNRNPYSTNRLSLAVQTHNDNNCKLLCANQ